VRAEQLREAPWIGELGPGQLEGRSHELQAFGS
jgi:hypothetical protein